MLDDVTGRFKNENLSLKSLIDTHMQNSMNIGKVSWGGFLSTLLLIWDHFSFSYPDIPTTQCPIRDGLLLCDNSYAFDVLISLHGSLIEAVRSQIIAGA